VAAATRREGSGAGVLRRDLVAAARAAVLRFAAFFAPSPRFLAAVFFPEGDAAFFFPARDPARAVVFPDERRA
jgi:hypothetical protein